MKIAGFNFRKIYVEKLGEKKGDLSINTKIGIPSIEPLKQDFVKTKEDLLKADFEYIINYEPSFAKIEIRGDVILALEPRKARELVKNWKSKEMSEEMKLSLFNLILRKSNIKALELEEEMGLPLHIPFPPLKVEKKE